MHNLAINKNTLKELASNEIKIISPDLRKLATVSLTMPVSNASVHHKRSHLPVPWDSQRSSMFGLHVFHMILRVLAACD